MAEAPDPARSPSRPRGSAGAARLQPYAGQADDHGQAAARCVVMTSIPAARNSPTSCRRRAILQPRSLGWARSSTRTTSGRRRSTASRSSARPCDATCPAFEEGDGVRASVALHEPGNHVRSPCGPAAALLKHPAGLAHAPSRPRGGPWAGRRDHGPPRQGGGRSKLLRFDEGCHQVPDQGDRDDQSDDVLNTHVPHCPFACAAFPRSCARVARALGGDASRRVSRSHFDGPLACRAAMLTAP